MESKTKITGLSRMNVMALDEVFRSRIQTGDITLGKTFAMFAMDATEAAELVQRAITHLPGRSHPKASLWAVKRRLDALTHQPPLEVADDIPPREVTEEERQAHRAATGEIDQAALFLADLHYPNMFELRGSDEYCKVCGDLVAKADQEPHHGAHRRDRSQYATEQIRARKEQNMAAKADKRNVPAMIAEANNVTSLAPYLREDGKAFRPGGDAQMKSDLTYAFYGWDRKGDGKAPAKVDFTQEQAAQVLSIFAYNGLAIKSKEAREVKENRAKAKAADKATKAKQAAATKKSKAKAPTDEVKPDPKPERKTRARGGRLGS